MKNSFSRKTLAALIAMVMVFSLFGVVAAATGEADPPIEEPVEASIALSNTVLRIRYHETALLQASTDPAQDFTFKTSNPKVAIVDADGNIEAVGPGIAIITVTTADELLSAECIVTVTLNPIDWFLIIISYVLALFKKV